MRITGCQYWDPKADRRPLVICMYCSVPDADLHIPMDVLNRGSERVDDLTISSFQSLDSDVVTVPAKKNNGLHIRPDSGATLELDISTIPCFGRLTDCKLSLAFWAKLDGGNTNRVMYIAGEAISLTVRENSGSSCPCKVAFELNGKNDESSSNYLNMDDWHHLALTWKSTNSNSATVKYYLDGEHHRTRAVNGGMPSASSIEGNHIKYQSDAVGITVDDLYLWGQELTAEDIKALYDTY